MKTSHMVGLAIMAPTLAAIIWAVNAPATKAVSLANKATDTTKMLANYEWFHDTSKTFNARVSAIQAHKGLIAEEKDPEELRRLRVEVNGMKQMCREMSANYASKTAQLHVGYLKSNDLPETLDAQQCE